MLLLLVACRGVSDGAYVPEPEPKPDSETPQADMINQSNVRQLPAAFDVQGHRGARGLKPENTLPSFETALDLGVSTLEMDLHFTADQEVVIWHDPAIDGSKCGLDPAARVDVRDPDSPVKWGSELMITNLTLAQVKAFRCDRNPEPDRFPEQENGPTALAGSDFRIMTLAELFDFVARYAVAEEKSAGQQENARRVRFNMETKRLPDSPQNIDDGFDGVNPGPFELEILHTVEEYGLHDRVTIQSFDHRSLWAIRKVDETIKLSVLTRGGVTEPAVYVEAGATAWSPRYNFASASLIEKAHEAGLLVIPWTVNDAADMRSLIALGVDGIISDRPDILLTLDLNE